MPKPDLDGAVVNFKALMPTFNVDGAVFIFQ